MAVEEALAELHAAYTTGKLDELKSRYNIEIPKGHEKPIVPSVEKPQPKMIDARDPQALKLAQDELFRKSSIESSQKSKQWGHERDKAGFGYWNGGVTR